MTSKKIKTMMKKRKFDLKIKRAIKKELKKKKVELRALVKNSSIKVLVVK